MFTAYWEKSGTVVVVTGEEVEIHLDRWHPRGSACDCLLEYAE